MSTIQCQNCGAENVGTVNFCKQCGSKLERVVLTAVATDSPSPNNPPPTALPRMGTAASPTPIRLETKFTSLHNIAATCKLLAYLLAGLVVLGGIGAFVITVSDSATSAVGALLGALIWAAIVYIFWRVIGEGISVLLDIEENTRRAAVLLQQKEHKS